MIRMLHIGDVIGEPGREAVAILLPRLKRELELDFVTAQGENCAGGFGITPRVAEQLFAAGVDAITLGNHAWDKKEGVELIEFDARVSREAAARLGPMDEMVCYGTRASALGLSPTG